MTPFSNNIRPRQYKHKTSSDHYSLLLIKQVRELKWNKYGTIQELRSTFSHTKSIYSDLVWSSLWVLFGNVSLYVDRMGHTDNKGLAWILVTLVWSFWFGLIWFGLGWFGLILYGHILLGLVWYGWDSCSRIISWMGHTKKQTNTHTKKTKTWWHVELLRN